jgi:hypothetical protein
MSGDYSRYGFDPTKDFSAVLMEQGRPLTDRDWNDQAIGLSRRLQAGSYDTFGAAVAPATTPNAFELTFDASDALWIGRGRMYVDGLMVENHGTGPLTNIIRRVGVNTPTAQSRAGIVSAGGDRGEISGNEISDVGPAGDFVGPSVGVSILQPFSSVQISDNVVRRYSPAALPANSDASPWTPIFVLGVIPQAAQTPGIMSVGDFAAMQQRFTLTNDIAKSNLSGLFNVDFAAPANPPPVPLSNKVGMRGNQLEGFGSSPVVLAFGAFDVVFSDNDCQQGTPQSQLAAGADVILAVNTAAVAQNHVIGGGTAMSIAVSGKGFSALGNLTRGQILFDGQPLAAPWSSLNVTGL